MEQEMNIIVVRGEVLKLSEDCTQVYLYLNGLLDDNKEGWIPIPPAMPEWALNGTVFKAELSQEIDTFEKLAKCSGALRRFSCRPRLTDEALKKHLELLDF